MGTEVVVTALAWDSEFWGEPSARVQLDEQSPSSVRAFGAAITQAQAAYDFVQVLVPASQIAHVQAAQRNDFVIVDMRCEVSLGIDTPMARATGDPLVRVATSYDVAPIAELASRCHGNSRFGADPALDPARVQELYRRWIRRDASADGWNLATVDQQERVAGYVSYGRHVDGHGTIGLIGVAPSARGQGVGAKLLSYAVETLFSAGCSRISVTTQAGSGSAMKMYQARGFKVDWLGYWLHWHRVPGGR